MFNKKLTEDEVDIILNKEFTAREILSLAPFMVCLVNDKGYFTDVNEMFIDVLGYTRQELINEPFISFVHPEDKDKTAQAYVNGSIIKEDGEVYKGFTNRYKTKSSKYAIIEWYTTDKEVEDGVVAYAIFRGYEQR